MENEIEITKGSPCNLASPRRKSKLAASSSSKEKKMVNKTHQAKEETVKSSSLKPKLRIKRNNMGSWVIFLFGMVFDLYVTWFNAFYTYQYGLFKGITFVGSEKYMLFASFLSLSAVIFSLIFTGSVLCVSSLTMQKQKRIKMAPYIVFAFFKLVLQLMKSRFLIFLGLFIKDLLLYVCMSHTAKNHIVRKYFKPYKQVVYYE